MEAALISTIRRNHGFDRDAADDPAFSELRGKLERALERLSSDLYHKKTHFLLEFIQNADDNEYGPDVVPALELRVEEGSIVIQCNEVGFTAENVRAICDIGGSTKAGGKARGFIGEKGIGFKSVFTVADEVHICSNNFNFKFDRKLPLGMITPIPDKSFTPKNGWTSFRLNLAPSESGAHLSSQLSEVRPTLLLFLRQLRSLNIALAVDGHRSRLTIKRSEPDGDIVTLSRVENGILSVSRYIMVRHIATTLPAEPKRDGVEESEVVLAFPVTDKDEPMISSQDVHAFLPLRSYGFSFIIQADLLTSASREDVLTDLMWNLSLRNSVVDAFMMAVDRFLESPSLRDVWYRYLPQEIPDSFFSVIKHAIFVRLRARPIWRSRGGTHHPATKVIILPSRFADEDGQPLVPAEYLPHGLHYLAPEYDAERNDKLFFGLGVLAMSEDLFLAGLFAMSQRNILRLQTNEWHDCVCDCLSHTRPHGRPFRPEVLALRILPLKDGTWAQALIARTITFDLDHLGVPEDLGIPTMMPGVEISPVRRRLYQDLGVASASPQTVAHKILADTSPNKSIKSLLQHARFFFDHRTSRPALPSPSQLRVMDRQGSLRRSDEMYLDCPLSIESLGNLSDVLSPDARFLHPQYLSAYDEDERDDWLDWLVDRVKLNISPRIINGRIAPELLDTAPIMGTGRFLLALRCFWPTIGTKLSPSGLRELSEMNIECTDGWRQSLKASYLPRGILKQHDLHFLPVNDPDSREWDFLGLLGVSLRMSATFYLDTLRRMQEQDQQDTEAAEEAYKQLDARFYDDEDLIRSAFVDEPLILAKRNNGVNAAWLRRYDGVYWHGPRSITSKVMISQTYRNLMDFFVKKLAISDAPPFVLSEEIRAIGKRYQGKTIPTEVQRDVVELLIDFNDALLDTAAIPGSFLTLKGLPIFPAETPSRGLALLPIDQLYVPDKTGKYADMFRGKVSLLSLPASTTLARIRPLLESDIYAPQVRYLEACVKKTSSSLGRRVLNQTKTEQYAMKVSYIARLLYHSRRTEPTTEQANFLIKLKNIAVWSVQSISTTLSLGRHIEKTNDDIMIEDLPERFTVLISRTHSDQSVDVSICEVLARILEVNFMLLWTCIVHSFDTVEHLLKVEGIEEIDQDPRHDRAWLQAISNSVPSPEPSPEPAIAETSQEAVHPDPSSAPPSNHLARPTSPTASQLSSVSVINSSHQRLATQDHTSKPTNLSFLARRSVSNAAPSEFSVDESFASSASIHSGSFFSSSSVPSTISASNSASSATVSTVSTATPSNPDFVTRMHAPTPTRPRYTSASASTRPTSISPFSDSASIVSQPFSVPRSSLQDPNNASLNATRPDDFESPLQSSTHPQQESQPLSADRRTPTGSVIASPRPGGTPRKQRPRHPSGVNVVMENLSPGAMPGSSLSFGSLGNLISQAPDGTLEMPSSPSLQPAAQGADSPQRQDSAGAEVSVEMPVAPDMPLGSNRPTSAAGGMALLETPESQNRGPLNMDYNAQPSEETGAIGVAGELFVYNMLVNALGLSFGPDNWTSELRGQVPGFLPYQGQSLADFTYRDVYGTLTAYWYGMEKMGAWRGHWPMFHIEVKATSGAENEPFHMSRRQMNTALMLTERGLSQIPTDVFVVVRVWGLGSPSPGFQVYTDPHWGLSSGHLVIASDLFLQRVGSNGGQSSGFQQGHAILMPYLVHPH
ncbi:hypothetical protein FA95DRAFT_1533561 [Auriscalpium vulgare]|uniref:Uncharacterized protein n=1 Tax=Auriscalpium vulgare TaxID=40419 RepID=A0ACB8S7W7_9AGAM|nr:hypothetical protein FA95DRAFT_1533561 [Auriscalpium vulgare]